MCPKWHGEIDNEYSGLGVRAKIEKIRQEKRSLRGRTTDDWIIDVTEKGHSEEDIEKEIELLIAAGYRRGRVIEAHKKHIFIAEENKNGEPDTRLLWLCIVARRHFQRSHKERNFVVVGDKVLFEPDNNVQLDNNGEPLPTDLPRGIIQHAFTRTSKLSRKDPMNPHWEHVMLANIGLMAIVASVLNPEVRWGLIDRMLVQAELESIPVVIILNKVDLLKNPKIASPEFLAIYNKRLQIYRDIGYEIIELCALHPKKTLTAAKRLRELFRGKIVGFCGHSGVGKSSVVNLMKPEFEQIVDENPEIFYKGRHTTSYNSLIRLDIGGYAIDTPGIRSFDSELISPIYLTSCFKEMASLKCQFRECSHILEPNCGVQNALKEGLISRERYRSYVGILKGVTFREGDGYIEDATEIADLKAREFARDNLQEENKKEDKVDTIETIDTDNTPKKRLQNTLRARLHRAKERRNTPDA